MKERIVRWIAWHLPKLWVYWCFIRVVSYATQEGVYANTVLPRITALEANRRWSRMMEGHAPQVQAEPVAPVSDFKPGVVVTIEGRDFFIKKQTNKDVVLRPVKES